ncbi:MAG TPA: hypothetical protein DCS43_01365 [Verrucomicrobia bacterium]|nr:hypothetical protein [Verrucomicrobiota bacterium]
MPFDDLAGHGNLLGPDLRGWCSLRWYPAGMGQKGDKSASCCRQKVAVEGRISRDHYCTSNTHEPGINK